MALKEISFFNIFGEEVNISNLVNQMIDYYDQKLSVGETSITDFTEGSEIRNLLEAFSVLGYAILEDENEAAKLPFISLSRGLYLDRIGENPFIMLPRIQGKESKGVVTFTLSAAQDYDIIIPVNTVLLDENVGLVFVTDADMSIPSGETSNDVPVSCATTGSDGNIPANTLTVIDDAAINTNLISVTNNEALSEGADYEDDEIYRERLLNYVKRDGFGTLGHYTSLGESVPGVHDVKLVDVTGYTKKVLVNGYVKPTTDEVLLNVLTVFSDAVNLVMGHTFTVDKPTVSSINLTFGLNVSSNIPTEELTSLVTAIANGGEWDRVSFDGLNIGENLTRQMLIDGLSYEGYIIEVSSIKITGSSSEFTSTNISSNQVVKINECVFNQTIIS